MPLFVSEPILPFQEVSDELEINEQDHSFEADENDITADLPPTPAATGRHWIYTVTWPSN
jgi:hypothetical protein